MSKSGIKVRLMNAEDFGAVVRIDEKILKVSRPEYYRLKFEDLVQSTNCLPTSLVAENKNGEIVGFIMGQLFIGEYGISQQATMDTIGVDPDYQDNGIGEKLLQEFIDHLKGLGVEKVNTLVDSDDLRLTHFFTANRFSPSKTVNLERSLRR